MSSKARKDLWRWRIKSALELQRPWDSTFAHERLQENLRLLVSSRPGIWGSYLPFQLEADPQIGPVNGIEWVYPQLIERHLVFCRAETFRKNSFGILEPDSAARPVDSAELTGIIVPALAFDRKGRRLGRGQGFYDRTLPKTKALKVGLASMIQVIKEVPVDPWDVKMDAVVTEKSVIWAEA